MSPTDKTAPSQTESISFEFDLPHAPETRLQQSFGK